MIEQFHNAAPFILSYTYVYVYFRFLLARSRTSPRISSDDVVYCLRMSDFIKVLFKMIHILDDKITMSD